MPDLSAEQIRGLPLSTRRLVEVIGLDATIRLLRLRGGQRVRMPATEDGDSPLEPVIGRPAVRALANTELAGERMTLPMINKILVEIRNAEIRAQRGRQTKAELAQRFGLHSRMIQHIWNSDPAVDDSTIDMFTKTASE